MDGKKFAKNYLKKLEKIYSKELEEIKEKRFSKEDFIFTMRKINLDILKNKFEKTLYFLENEEYKNWQEYNSRLEELILDIINFYEMYSLDFVREQRNK